MRKREVISYEGKRLFDSTEVCAYLSLGRNKGIEFAKAIGSERKIGRRCLYDKAAIDRALDEMSKSI